LEGDNKEELKSLPNAKKKHELKRNAKQVCGALFDGLVVKNGHVRHISSLQNILLPIK
jgi:hypothetical protein